ncbi:MAG: DUF4998 domain-containing protein [Bacteroidales bacterium]|jgi:hypothetical protein|nr:DUF4998 domain-containing protein [Bacteroidales bacterium]
MKTIFKNWKRYAVLFAVPAVASLVTGGCDRDAIYDNIKQFSEKEEIYPAKFDTIFGRIGYERVEIDLRKDGRIPSSKIEMGKAKKTVVAYDEDTPTPTVIRIDSVCSYVNVTGLTEPRQYRFKIYTEDGAGNRSTPQEISLVPYTSADREVLRQGILDPTVSAASSALIMEWPAGLHSIMMEYHGLKYEYVDADNVPHADSLDIAPRIYANNLPAGGETVFNFTYRVLPILEDGSTLLDTIPVEKPFAVQMPTAEQPFIPSELSILRANGINDFTLAAADAVTELTYPMTMTTFADLFYFSNVATLDLTGKGLPGILETLTYARNNVTSIVGGGAWQEFMMPVDQPARIRETTGRAPESLQTLKDAIDGGILTKIRYIPKSMGTVFDEFLQPYVQSGVVELLGYNTLAGNEFFPDSVYVDRQFFASGTVQDNAWDMILSYSGDVLPNSTDIVRFNPAAETVNSATVNMNLNQLLQSDGKNIYRCVIRSSNASFFFALPRQWRYDNQRYPYLKFKMMIGCDKSLVSNTGEPRTNNYRKPWIRPMNHLWAFGSNSDYGQEYVELARSAFSAITDDEIDNKTWHEYTVDMSFNDGGDNSNRRHRVYVFNPGQEDIGGNWSYNASSQIVLYIADFRLCKTAND